MKTKMFFSKVKEFSALIAVVAVCILSYPLTRGFSGYVLSGKGIETCENENAAMLEKDMSSESVREDGDDKTSSTLHDIPYITDTKLVKSCSGGIAVYDCFGNLEYTRTYDSSRLTPDDRRELRTGIIFDSENELEQFLDEISR